MTHVIGTMPEVALVSDDDDGSDGGDDDGGADGDYDMSTTAGTTFGQ